MNIGRLINRLPDIVEKLRAATDEFAVIKRISGGDFSITSRLIRQEAKAEAVFSLADNHLVYKFEDSEFMSTWGGAAAFRELEKLSVATKKPILIHGAQTPGPFARRGSVQRAAPGSQSFYYTPPSNPRNVDANLFLQAYGAGTVHTSHFDALSELQLRRNRFVPISELKDKLIYRNMSSQRGAEKSLISFGGTDEKPLLNFINYSSGPRYQGRRTLEIDYIQSQEYGMGHRLFNEVARRAFRLDRDIYSLELLSNAGKRSPSLKDQPARKTKFIPADAAPGPDLVMSVFPQLRYRLKAGYTSSTAKTHPFRGRTFEANSVHEIVKKLSGLGRDDLRYTMIEDVYTPVTGMPKGGMNDQLRKFVNPAVLLAGVGAGLYSADKGFGSPWRGIISVSREFLSLLDNDIPRGAVLRKAQLDSFNLLGSVKEGTALHTEVTDVLKKANIFYENTNDVYEKLILVRKDLPLAEVKEVIRHERSHQVFAAMADHSREYATKKMLGRPTKSSIRNAFIQTFRRIGYTWAELNADSYIVTHKMLFPGKEHIAATDEIMATLIGAKKANFESFRRITGKSETADELVELTRYIKGKGRSYLNAHLKEVRAKYFANAVEGMPEQGANKEMRLLINPEAQGLGPDRGSGSAWRKLFAGKGLAEAFRTALKKLNLTVHVDRWLQGARYTPVTNSIFIPPEGTPFSRIATLFHEIAEAHHDSRRFKGLPQKLGKRLAKLSKHPEVLRRKRLIATDAYVSSDDLDFVDAVRDSVLTRLTNKLLRENEKPLRLRTQFAGHASSAVIADEALFARSISKTHFIKYRALRMGELSRLQAGRSLESLTEAEVEYIRRTKQIYRNVEKKWPLIAKKFGLPENNVEPYPLASYLQTEPRVQGMQEYGHNKSLRDVIKPSVMMLGIAGGLFAADKGFGSQWRGIARVVNDFLDVTVNEKAWQGFVKDARDGWSIIATTGLRDYMERRASGDPTASFINTKGTERVATHLFNKIMHGASKESIRYDVAGLKRVEENLDNYIAFANQYRNAMSDGLLAHAVELARKENPKINIMDIVKVTRKGVRDHFVSKFARDIDDKVTRVLGLPPREALESTFDNVEVIDRFEYARSTNQDWSKIKHDLTVEAFKDAPKGVLRDYFFQRFHDKMSQNAKSVSSHETVKNLAMPIAPTIHQQIMDSLNSGARASKITPNTIKRIKQKIADEKYYTHTTNFEIEQVGAIAPGPHNVYHDTGHVGVYVSSDSSLYRDDDRVVMIPKRLGEKLGFKYRTSGIAATEDSAIVLTDFRTIKASDSGVTYSMFTDALDRLNIKEIVKAHPAIQSFMGEQPAFREDRIARAAMAAKDVDLSSRMVVFEEVMRGPVFNDRLIEDVTRTTKYSVAALATDLPSFISQTDNNKTYIFVKDAMPIPVSPSKAREGAYLMTKRGGGDDIFAAYSNNKFPLAGSSIETRKNLISFANEIRELGMDVFIKGGTARGKAIKSLFGEASGLQTQSEDIDLLVVGGTLQKEDIVRKVTALQLKHDTTVDWAWSPSLEEAASHEPSTITQMYMGIPKSFSEETVLYMTEAASETLIKKEITFYPDSADSYRMRKIQEKMSKYFPGFKQIMAPSGIAVHIPKGMVQVPVEFKSPWAGPSITLEISEDMSRNEMDLVDPYAYIDYTPGSYGDLRESDVFARALKKRGISDPESVFGVRLGSTTAILPEEEIYDAMAHPGGGNYTSDYVKGTMEIGNKIHKYAQAQLAEQQLLKYAEKKALIGTSGIYGFLDAVDIAEGIWEFKSISNSVLQTLSEPYPSHVKQLQLYMHASGQTSGVIEYIARDDLSFRKRFVVSYDEKIAQSTINTVALAREHLLNDLKSGALSKSDIVRKTHEEFYNTAPEYVSPADLDLEDARKDYYRYLESFNQLKRPVPGNLDEIIAARTQYNMTTPRGQGYDIIDPKYTSKEYVRASAAEKSRIVGEDNYETLQNEVNYVKQKRQKQMKDNPMYYANQMVESNNGYSMLSSTTPKRGY